MSSQSNLVRSFSMCAKYLRGKKSGNLSRAISYCTPYDYWHNPRNTMINVKAMKRNALVSSDASMRRYDDRYGGKLNGNKDRVPDEKAGRESISRRSYDEDDMPDERNARSQHEMGLDERQENDNLPAQKRGDKGDKFVSAYDDAGTAKRTKQKSDRDEQGNSNKNWRTWNHQPDRRNEEYITERNRQDPMDRERRLHTPRIPYEELKLQWQSRTEPSRRIKRPPEASGTVYKFLKPLHNLQPVPPTTNPEESISNKKSRKYDSKYKDMQRKALEQKYWHHWESCPEERNINMSSDTTSEVKKRQRPQGVQSYGASKEQDGKRLVQPTKPYESPKRKYQTSTKDYQSFGNGIVQVPQVASLPHFLSKKTSFDKDVEEQEVNIIKPIRKSVAPPRYRLFIRPQVRRKQSGMEKLFQLAWDYSLSKNSKADQCHKIVHPNKRETFSSTKKMDFSKRAVSSPPRPQCPTSYCESSTNYRPSLSNTFEDPNSPPICHFKDVTVIPELRMSAAYLNRSTQSVAPPKLPMSIRKYTTKRCAVPVPCFSERIKVNPTKLSHSKFTGDLM